MTAKNISLDRYKQRFFGDFLELPGLTEIAVNRPVSCIPKSTAYGSSTPFLCPMRIATTLPGARQSTTATISKILSRGCQPRWNLANGAG